MGWIFSAAILIADIWALWNVFECNETTGTKVMWAAVILLFPLLGFLAWYFFGPKK
jgi:hypothetical protein